MAYKIQSSFSAGELDPALWERTTLDKYKTGLRTLRNAVIGKTGRIISRPGRMKYAQARAVETTAGTFTAAVSDICTKTAHFMATGATVVLTTSNTLPAGLSLATTYYVIYLSEDTFSLATSSANAYAGTAINITGTGTGVHTITPTDLGVRSCTTYSPPYLPYLIEWGHTYARIHDTSTGGVTTIDHSWGESDIPYLQFFTSGIYTYILRTGKTSRKMVTSTGVFLTSAQTFFAPPAPTLGTLGTTSGTGRLVTYVFTYMSAAGEESATSDPLVGLPLPILAGEVTSFTIDVGANSAIEARIYRRPGSGNAYGYIGSTSLGSGPFAFTDYGEDADYSHNPPTLDFTIVATAKPRTGCVYQQKLMLSEDTNREAVHASRTGFQSNFYRDYPLSSDSALTFKCGTSGSAIVTRMLDNGGLLIFTTVGIYKSSGALTPENLSLDKIGNWVINEKVPPLEVPGGILFIDKTTNTARTLIYSNEAGGYPGDEVSIYSNHLFLNKVVVSWAFQDGDIPLVWVVFDDGSLVALTYQREQQMQAWSRHDSSDGLYESVCVVKDLEAKSKVYFVVNRSGLRYIEYSSERFFADVKDFVGMDCATTFKSALSYTVTVAAVVADTWDGSLTLTGTAGTFANTAGNGAIGSVFKFFDSDGCSILLTVTAYTSTSVVTVTPDSLFPEAEITEVQLYKTYTVLTGLSHLEGLDVAVTADGYVVSSPNNIEYANDILTVSGGALTLPSGYESSAIVHVGIPFVTDIEPLDVDTVEQKPTLLESCLANRLHLKVYNTRGMYLAAKFPSDETNLDMVDPEVRIDEDGNDDDVFGNACQQPYTRRLKFDIPGDWKSNGRVCIRQVDPLPLEILSLIPDLEIYRS